LLVTVSPRLSRKTIQKEGIENRYNSIESKQHML
ncbi:unnamed protein product, partial [Brassica rapa subsp. narinosa]